MSGGRAPRRAHHRVLKQQTQLLRWAQIDPMTQLTLRGFSLWTKRYSVCFKTSIEEEKNLGPLISKGEGGGLDHQKNTLGREKLAHRAHNANSMWLSKYTSFRHSQMPF